MTCLEKSLTHLSLCYRLESSSRIPNECLPCHPLPGEGRASCHLPWSGKETWPLVGKHFVSLNQERGGHPQTLLLTLGTLYPPSEEQLLQCLQGGIQRRDDIWFSEGQLVDFDCLGRGLLWLSCLFFPPWDRGC